MGAALAVWRAQRPGPLSRQLRLALSAGGVVALIATIGIWATVDGQSKGLYAGGFLAVAITVALLVAAIVEVPGGAASRVLALQPLPYIGKISYGLYLWHWPVFLTLTAGRTGVSGTALLVLRLAVTFAITVAVVPPRREPDPARHRPGPVATGGGTGDGGRRARRGRAGNHRVRQRRARRPTSRPWLATRRRRPPRRARPTLGQGLRWRPDRCG